MQGYNSSSHKAPEKQHLVVESHIYLSCIQPANKTKILRDPKSWHYLGRL